jgi:outer membrane protein assembly factor BamB
MWTLLQCYHRSRSRHADDVVNMLIFQTNPVNNSVTCYTINGEKLWEFNDASVLRQPIGVAVDNNCNIYVTSFYYNKVIVLSPDGKRCSPELIVSNIRVCGLSNAPVSSQSLSLKCTKM